MRQRFSLGPSLLPALVLLFSAALPAQEIVVNAQGNGNELTLRNDDQYSHFDDNDLSLNVGVGSFLVGSYDGTSQRETSVVYGDDDAILLWSPGDSPVVPSAPPDALVYVVDEDLFTDDNGDPYDNGALIAYLDAAGLWQQSDRRRKTALLALGGAVERVRALNGYTYEFERTDEELAKGAQHERRAGLLAHEVANVLPEAVAANAYGEMWVNYSAVVPLLIEAIKEQQVELEELRAKLEEVDRRGSWPR